jgi:hypothetical protein
MSGVLFLLFAPLSGLWSTGAIMELQKEEAEARAALAALDANAGAKAPSVFCF